MLKRYATVLALTLLQIASMPAEGAAHGAALKTDADNYAAWRAATVRVLAAREDADSLATAAALTFVGPPARPKAESVKAASAALDFAVKAGELAPQNPAIAWLRVQLCANVPSCDIREAATTLRWVDADNAAAWLPTLAAAQKDRDTVQVDRVLAAMAEGTRFDLYGNRTAVLMYDALRKVRGAVPVNYLKSDLARVTEAMGIAGAVVMPSFSPLINACRDATAAERREACLRLSKIMQRADAVMTQLVGFAIAKRLATDTRELRMISERRRSLEWRLSAANQSDTPLLPWLRNARARSRMAKMRAMPREEDVCIALLREHGLPLDPPEEHR